MPTILKALQYLVQIQIRDSRWARVRVRWGYTVVKAKTIQQVSSRKHLVANTVMSAVVCAHRNHPCNSVDNTCSSIADMPTCQPSLRFAAVHATLSRRYFRWSLDRVVAGNRILPEISSYNPHYWNDMMKSINHIEIKDHKNSQYNNHYAPERWFILISIAVLSGRFLYCLHKSVDYCALFFIFFFNLF